MSIALWKTVLTVAKAGAALLILGALLLFWGHHREMGSAWAAPDFSPPIVVLGEKVAKTESLGIALGRFQKVRPAIEAPPEDKPKDVITDVLAQLCEITNAIIIPPPYVEGGFAPALIIRFKQKPANEPNETRTIRLGEALIEKPDPRGWKYPAIPVKYKFVGCERDPENPRGAFFLFDMKCDGTDIQKARWVVEEPKEQPKDDSGPTGPVPVSTGKMYVGPPLSGAPVEESPGEVKVEPVPAVAPPPVQPPLTVELTGSLFEEEDGVFAPTADGVDYLEKNYEKILEDTRTENYRDRDGRTGVRVVGISNASVANQFGIRKDDVILKINGTSVGSQSEAVNVVKGELKKKVRIIKITIRRAGREIEKSFDTRDPATRRAAKKGFGNR